ncbi:MAG: phosphoribosylformylglycinamidine synthase, partial [Bacteroidales bacterium]|nr:phosphoribosylformylglycinamidine synthase [Bacteroidales bacterium]MDD4742918.1 phosphoribosylformylglycinamidine synthase [Bacteroidales bacterium]
MISFFRHDGKIYALESSAALTNDDIQKLTWLLGGASRIREERLQGSFVGPRKEMITPWSTNAVEIARNMGIDSLQRMEVFVQAASETPAYDPMLSTHYRQLDQQLFSINRTPEAIKTIRDIATYNTTEGLALSDEEVEYLHQLSNRLGRPLTDSEVYGFAQVNSEHCRHKIFNGTFIIDGKEMPESLFSLIRKTSAVNPNKIVSAYKDNVAFVRGPAITQFAPARQDTAACFELSDRQSVISLKAETHNFPTTVEPFNGAATGTGGEIRDRMAGGTGSMPLAGTAVYMTSYPRLEAAHLWEQQNPERPWLYHPPIDLLIKASNGASDFGNKFGQPLICGSVLTFEHIGEDKKYGYDKMIMLAGGIGYGYEKDALKNVPESGDAVVVLGGDNYRIGMGGGAVSSVATGEFANQIELNAVQRSNPEMQKRVYNALRAMAEKEENPIVTLHDHGAGGHLNCLSELVEETGAIIHLEKLPVGDSTLSDKEIIGNESQERMGLVIRNADLKLLQEVARRERAPIYQVGEVTGDHRLVFARSSQPVNPIDLHLTDFFGKPPRTVLEDTLQQLRFEELSYDIHKIHNYIEAVLQLEAVACKDWLTNKVDRSVTGRVALQQCAGELQLPLNNCGVAALSYNDFRGVATSIGHAPVASLINPAHGAVLSVAEALTNIVWAPIEGGLKGVSLSANWMWPARNPGENARLYKAVEAVSNFAIKLGINIPTGKDSLSMTQRYPDGQKVLSPGTVIISAAAEVSDFRKTIKPVLIREEDTEIIYVSFSKSAFALGGSSFAQILNQPGTQTPLVADPSYFATAFDAIQQLINQEMILAGHDVSAGGLVTTLLEMNFANTSGGMSVNLNKLDIDDLIQVLFSEKPGVIIQTRTADKVAGQLAAAGVEAFAIGRPIAERQLMIDHLMHTFTFDIDSLRDVWYKTSYLLDRHQSTPALALERFGNYKRQPLKFRFMAGFEGTLQQFGLDANRRKPSGIRAAIIREKGVNGDREMAWAMYLAGMEVKDVHTTDLIAGRETLQDIHLIVFVGGFSNSDVLGAGKGWAAALLYNEKARQALQDFYDRPDTLSLGVCNGCQLMTELGFIYPKHQQHPKMLHNASGKFESGFVNVEIENNDSVMLRSLAGSRLGIWVAHGEGRFGFPESEAHYNIPMRYS